MDLRWQDFGNPELRKGLSPFIYSLKGVVRMQDLPLLKTEVSMLVPVNIIPLLFWQELFEG